MDEEYGVWSEFADEGLLEMEEQSEEQQSEEE